MAEYSRMAKGHVTTLAAGGIAPVNLPFQPDVVRWVNFTAQGSPTSPQVVKGYWDVSMGQGAASLDFYAAGPVYSTENITSGGVTTFAGGTLLQFGARQQVVSATAANPIVFTVTGHGYAVGDTVIFEGLYQSSTTGMPQICGIPFTISAVSTNTFTIKWDGSGSNYTALSGSPTGAFVKKVLYPFLYEPGTAFISALTLSSSTTVVTTDYHNFTVGQEVAFRIPTAWGTTQLNSLPNVLIPGSPIYGFVTSVTDNWTFVVNIISTGYTAFNVNQTVASVPGLSFPQVLAVGDINTGGVQISAGSNLYPSPVFPTGSGGASTINGPAIQGAFVNNTNQGFFIGTSGAPTASQVIYWEAFLHDLAIN